MLCAESVGRERVRKISVEIGLVLFDFSEVEKGDSFLSYFVFVHWCVCLGVLEVRDLCEFITSAYSISISISISRIKSLCPGYRISLLKKISSVWKITNDKKRIVSGKIVLAVRRETN